MRALLGAEAESSTLGMTLGICRTPAQVRFSLEFLMAKQRWRNMQARFRDGQQVVSTTYYETCR